ncbi:streptophobe family protein [Streptomyces sp. NBC_00289]|uniref:streptophobe family protein n=1 Tax=Streptomyces sp. NBC_00289 TaxID=2975703 RepID=UPI00324FDBA0
MRASTNVRATAYDTKVPWGDVLLSAIAAVSWALIGMAGTAALGLHLLEADTAGSLGPMTAAVVALGAGGSVTPSGDVSAFGLSGAQANTAIEITPLGVSLVGALLLTWFFLRSLRAAGVVITPTELLARAGAVVALFVAMLGGLAWAGHDVITIDGGSLGLDNLPGGGGGGGGLDIPGLGDVGDIGGLLPDRLGDLVDAKAAVGFTVDTAPTLLGGLVWSAGILLIALLASRRTPLPLGWEAVHRVVRPAVSALVTVLLTAVAAGFAAAAYAAIGDDHPKRIAGAALLGAPNGTWLGIPVGLFVPYDGQATGVLTKVLPHPLDDLLSTKSDQPVTLGRLAELDGRVWLLGVAAALMMLLAGVLTAVRTPGGGGAGAGGAEFGARGGTGARAGAVSQGAGVPGGEAGRDPGALGFAGRCALRLGIATALTLPLLGWLTAVSVDASLSVLGFDAFGAGVRLNGHLGMALVLGALWGAGAGAVGALLARASGAAGRRATPLALGVAAGVGVPRGEARGVGAPGVEAPTAGPSGYPPYGAGAGAGAGAGPGVVGEGPGAYGGESGPYSGGPTPHGNQDGPYAGKPGPYAERGRPRAGEQGPYAGQGGPQAGGQGPYADEPEPHAGEPGPPYADGPGRPYPGAPEPASGEQGPYVPGMPYRPPNPDTNPYLRVPDEAREPQDARPTDARPDAEDPGGGGKGARPPRARPDDSGRGGKPAGRAAPPSDGSPRAGEARRPGDSRPPPNVYGAPTVARPITPPPRSPQQPPRSRPGDRRSPSSDDGPPPPPPPPPAPPRRPKGPR